MSGNGNTKHELLDFNLLVLLLDVSLHHLRISPAQFSG